MKVKMVAIEDVVPYARNPRKNMAAISKVSASLKEFGWQQPVVVDKDMVVIAGHTRLEAARTLDMKKVPVQIADKLTDAQVKAYRIADNRVSQEAEWDIDLLKLELSDLDGLDYDLLLTGFDDDELNGMLIEAVEEGLTDEDEVPPLPEQPVSVLGDVWTLGNHRLMCGDSVNFDSVDNLLEGKKAEMVFTDPPYGVSYQSNMRVKSEKFDVIKNDDTLMDIVPIIQEYSLGWVFIWTSWKVQSKWLDNTQTLGDPTNIIIWHKGGGGIGDLKKTFSSDYEVALVWNRGKEILGKRIGSVWKIGKDGSSSYLHPTQKPVELCVEALDKTTKPKMKILDLFGGSGSTLKYVDVIINRWQDFTGKEAVHAETGKTYNDMKAERDGGE
jgi:DNA modification methylase